MLLTHRAGGTALSAASLAVVGSGNGMDLGTLLVTTGGWSTTGIVDYGPTFPLSLELHVLMKHSESSWTLFPGTFWGALDVYVAPVDPVSYATAAAPADIRVTDGVPPTPTYVQQSFPDGVNPFQQYGNCQLQGTLYLADLNTFQARSKIRIGLAAGKSPLPPKFVIVLRANSIKQDAPLEDGAGDNAVYIAQLSLAESPG